MQGQEESRRGTELNRLIGKELYDVCEAEEVSFGDKLICCSHESRTSLLLGCQGTRHNRK